MCVRNLIPLYFYEQFFRYYFRCPYKLNYFNVVSKFNFQPFFTLYKITNVVIGYTLLNKHVQVI